MRDIVPELEKLGANLVAITPQLQVHNRGLVEKHGLNFPLLTDPGNTYAEKLGLRFRLPDELQEIYANVGNINLPVVNGDDSWTLPIPARIVVDRSGIVRAADIDPDYTQRPEPSKTLADVRSLR